MTRIGVVTVTYNSISVLPDFLASMWKQTHSEFLLYIVDSGSTDGTQDSIRGISDPRVRPVIREENVGFAAGSNLGIKMALGEGCEAIMLLNNDTVFGADLLQHLRDGLERYRCDMTTPKMLYYAPPNKIWAAGGHLNKWLAYRNHHDGENQLDDGRFDRPRRVTFTPFCCVLMHRRVIEAIGYLDERYFVYTEDADYCFRAMRAGLSTWYVPEAKLWHKVSSLTVKMSDFAVRYCTRNRIFFMRKNLSAPVAWLWYWVYRGYYGVDFLARNTSRAVWKLRVDSANEGWSMHTEV